MTETVRKYLLTLVLKPEAKKDDIVKVAKDTLGENGKIEWEEELPLKKLAYAVSGSTEAIVLQLSLSATPEGIENLKREIRLQDSVNRYLVNKVEETKQELTKKEAKA